MEKVLKFRLKAFFLGLFIILISIFLIILNKYLYSVFSFIERMGIFMFIFGGLLIGASIIYYSFSKQLGEDFK